MIKTDTVTNILMIPITSNEISLRPVLAISRHYVVITTGFIQFVSGYLFTVF